jgi:hypothetical protein
MKTTESKRPVGRPVADPTGKQAKTTVNLSPAEKLHLVNRFGSVNAGVRALVTRDMTK